MNLTFGDLFRLPGAGSQVVLDVTATAEGAIDYFNSLMNDFTERDPGAESWGSFSDLEDAISEPWSFQVSDSDPRFSPHLAAVGRGIVHDRIDEILSNPDGVELIAQIPQWLVAIQKIRKTCEDIAGLSLEDSLSQYMQLITGATGDRLDALLGRFGWSGNNVMTLDEAGQIIGVTRERMRQLQKKALGKISGYGVFMPKLDMAIAVLEESTPISLEEASEKLIEHGITKIVFNIESLLEAASSLGRSPALQIRELTRGKFLVKNSEGEWINSAYSLARRLAGKSGVSSIYQVQSELSRQGVEVSEDDIQKVLIAGSNIEFLNSDWFWITDIPLDRNRLRNLGRKILSVISPQSISSIRDGVRRYFKMRSSSGEAFRSLVVPPQNVMKAFFERHSEFAVSGDTAALSSPVDYRAVLGQTDRVMVDVLRSAPAGVLDRRSFAEECMKRGMNENTFALFTSYSCVVEHAAVDLWKLRGLAVDPATLEAFKRQNDLGKREKRAIRYGWNEAGQLWMAAEIPKFGKSSLVIYLPTAVSRYLAGQQFAAISKDNGDACGTIAFTETGNSYGYGKFVTRFGLDENDVLLAEFDIAKNTASLSIGSEELLFDSD